MAYPPGYVPWTETRNLAEAVRLMTRRSDHRLAVEQLITHRFAIEDAEEAYGLVTGGGERHLGVVLTYGEGRKPATQSLRIPITVSGPKRASGCILGRWRKFWVIRWIR